MSLPRKTKALVLRNYDAPLKLETLNVSNLADNEALVEMHATGICHTDLSCMKAPFPTPYILGHEGAGVIIEVGKGLMTKFSPGDKVLLSFNFCGACISCQNDHPAYCQNFVPSNIFGRRPDGTFIYTSEEIDQSSHVLGGFFGQSSFASHAVVQENCLIKVSEQSNLTLLAPLGCGVQTGVGCVLNTLQVKKGSSFAIFGAGAVGLSALIAAKGTGANPIIAIDLIESRLELAKELGATHVVNGSSKDVVDEIRNITAPTKGVTYAIDATGVIPVIENMIDALGTMGKGATVGVPASGAKVTVNPTALMGLGKSYVGCTEGDSNPQQFIPYLVSEVESGRFPLQKLIKTYHFTDFQNAIDDMISGKTLKPVLLWK